MKQRFTSLDLSILTPELASTLPGFRLTQIYDLSPRIFLLKFSLPDRKHLLILDSGFRAHLTSFTRETLPTPSAFVAKLRKHLKSKRCTGVRQLGTDRVLEFQFSEGRFYLYLEFYAAGNVVLCDEERTILAVLRVVQKGEEGSERGECRVGATYQLPEEKVEMRTVRERVEDALRGAVAKAEGPESEEPTQQKSGKNFKKGKKGTDAIKRVLGYRMSEFSPVMVEHCLIGADVGPAIKPEAVLESEELLEKVVRAMEEAQRVIKELKEKPEEQKKGYIIARLPKEKAEKVEKPKEKGKKAVSFGEAAPPPEDREDQEGKVQEEGEAKGMVFEDFHPFLPRQFVDSPGLKVLEYDSFNKAVDTFFSSIESQKLASRLAEREAAAAARLQKARNEHESRVAALRTVQDLNVRKAEAISANTEAVESAIAAVNTLIQQGMDWVAMAQLIELEQQRGNPTAELIHLPMKLDQNTITLKLWEVDWEAVYAEEAGLDVDESDSESESDDEEGATETTKPGRKPLLIDVSLVDSAFANARRYYEQKRSAAAKESKTLASSTKALKSTEKKIQHDLAKGLKNEKTIMRPVRAPLWFEKFLFFISSDGYLCLGGRDAQQSELLYRKYFKKGDIYVHADITGAAPVIVKNKPSTPGAPIPPGTLQQAGSLAVCTSQAWDQKAVMGAWWVTFEQVSKTAETGDYLEVGKFVIKGRKNFLPPSQLLLGFGVLWRVDEESAKRHGKHRIETDEEKLVVEGGAEKTNEVEPEVKDEETKDESDDDKDADDDSDEEFPDAKVESDDEEFPDAKVESDAELDKEGEASELEPSESTAAVPASTETDKYGLPITAISNLTTSSPPSSPKPSPTTSAKPRLSAKQRRDLKKGKSTTDPTSTQPTTRSTSPAPSTAPSTSAPLPRGKRAKQKRAAAKYALQDEEDKLIARELLGVGSTPIPSTPVEPSEPKETPDQRKARLRAQHQKHQTLGLAAEATRGEDDDEDELAAIAATQLSHLIPNPGPEDVILDAVPVCAPWAAMGRFKWRIKVQPGNVKKGKAVREVLEGWVGEKRGQMRGVEREKVEGWKEGEVLNCVAVKGVKMMTSGGGGDKEKGDKGKGKGGGGGKKGGMKRGKGSKRG